MDKVSNEEVMIRVVIIGELLCEIRVKQLR